VDCLLVNTGRGLTFLTFREFFGSDGKGSEGKGGRDKEEGDGDEEDNEEVKGEGSERGARFVDLGGGSLFTSSNSGSGS